MIQSLTRNGLKTWMDGLDKGIIAPGVAMASREYIYFPSSLKKFVVFVDIVPSFCQMAENVLQTQIELVINRLKEAIDGADGFQNTHQPQQFELAKFSIDQLQRLVHMALENLLLLLHSVTGEVDERLKLMEGALFDELIPSLRKLRRLADLFDMPLKSITSLWQSGELINDSFTSSEVENFIRAVFFDSPLRKECLRRIETAQK
ncbi:hypothetical protein HPP92_028628 [Vanilla planifolia]|uniref:ZW10 C-terminal helical domain-containing protein n=1 Tax=Vanilla planifolia TaxID=51239 RepID=A0A835P6L8_VANPL|nr:hypothetical protein HPP92_028628 [Vanilla planifolia]